MKEINLKTPYVPHRHSGPYQPSIDMMQILNDIVNNVERKEKVYIKMTNGVFKDSIAYIKTIKEHKCEESPDRWSSTPSARQYTINMEVVLAFDDRKNVTTQNIFNDGFIYLSEYEGPTIWSKTDVKTEAAKIKAETIVHDMRDVQLNEGDTVIYINARYGEGSQLAFGIIDEIKVKVSFNWRGSQEVETLVIIKNLEQNSDGAAVVSKIKNPSQYILNVTDNIIGEEILMEKMVQ